MHTSIKHPPTETTNPIGYRLRLEMKRRGITSTDLAKRADVKTSFIYDIISGKSANPSTVKLARVATHLGVSLTYLVGNSDDQTAGIAGHTANSYVTLPHIMVDVSAGGNSIISRQQDGEPCSFRAQWLSERFGAGVDTLRLLHIRGDSMEPTLCHNDSVLIDLTKKMPSPPGLFAVFDGFALVVKRLEYLGQHTPPRIRIISDNAQYSTYERAASDTFIIGRVVWFAREI